MGLDDYPSRSPGKCSQSPEDEAALLLGLPLCEFGPCGSVRGKVCIDVVDPVAGVSLTAEWIACE